MRELENRKENIQFTGIAAQQPIIQKKREATLKMMQPQNTESSYQ